MATWIVLLLVISIIALVSTLVLTPEAEREARETDVFYYLLLVLFPITFSSL